MKLSITCVECDKLYEFDVDPVAYARWQRGMLIQQAFPDLPASLRELMISQICGTCFDKLFDEADEDEDTTGGVS
jgi:hypothetical protein